MNDWLYHLLALGLQVSLWGGDLIGEENLPKQGPAVLVANHAEVWGPIGVLACVPRRLHPWIIADMMDAKLAPNYLRVDFIERQLHLSPPLSTWTADALSKVTVPLFERTGCIPVYSDFEEMHIPFEQSVDVLEQEGFILIFPEDSKQPMNPIDKMRPFKKGFVRLAEYYFQRKGEALSFHPLAVHSQQRNVQVGRPVTHNPHAQLVGERLRVKHVLEQTIHEMLDDTKRKVFYRVPLAR